MNQEYKINSFKKILLVMTEDKNKLVVDLNRIKFYLEKKIHSLNCLLEYKSGYNNTDNRHQSCIPSLLQNKLAFIKKLDNAIELENKHISLLEYEKVSVITKIEAIDLKIKAIESQINELSNRMKIHEEEMELANQSDLTINSVIKDTK